MMLEVHDFIHFFMILFNPGNREKTGKMPRKTEKILGLGTVHFLVHF